ncbi:MAG TPA: Rrf2 family transcriptional regulator, partial [Candidatus Hydrogenedentes bacterium]|nr:Rrf2 family transcriptional regulator [Candidatus Hydrogenedentota bacterium]
MNISARCEYACRAMAELALHHGDGAVITVQELANRRHIPEKYLVHILLQLKRAGLVASVRGAQGGYSLSESPDRITLLQIVAAIDGPVLTPLPVDEGDTLTLLYGLRKLGWTDVPVDRDGFVAVGDLRRALVHDPGKFSRRIKDCVKRGLIEVSKSAIRQNYAEAVRITEAGA